MNQSKDHYCAVFMQLVVLITMARAIARSVASQGHTVVDGFRVLMNVFMIMCVLMAMFMIVRMNDACKRARRSIDRDRQSYQSQ